MSKAKHQFNKTFGDQQIKKKKYICEASFSKEVWTNESSEKKKKIYICTS